jgi:PAS domain S-box-containing protein
MKSLPPARLLDDGLDELAATSHAGFKPRLVMNVVVAGVFAMVIPWRISVIWGCVSVGLEIATWLINNRPQYQTGRPSGWRRRLWHAGCLTVACLLWVGLGALSWMSGTLEGALCAVVIWLALISFSQTNAYRSLLGFTIGGAMPALVVVAVVLLAPHPPGLKLAPFATVLVMAFAFAFDGAARMRRARLGLDETRAELSRNEALYRVLADNATDVISLLDVTGRRLYVSPSAGRVLGYPPEDLYAMPIDSFVHPDDLAGLKAQMDRLAARGGDATAQYRVIRANGAAIWVETTFSLAGGEDGRPWRVISVARNIQQRKELEAELIGARVAAEAAAAAKSDFLANMTHELRTPLHAIIGFAGVLKDSPRLEGPDARHARLIGEASQTLLGLVNDVLDLSRLEAGAVELDPAPIDPAVEAARVADLLSGEAAAKGLELVVDTRCDNLLAGDAKRLRQVLLNLLSNAIKFTARGKVTLTLIQVPAEGGAARLRAQVADTGVGIPPAQLPHVFERFTQADVSVSRRFGGTGLGLAICKRIVELMGGEIGVDSVEGEGSTFWFEVTLPVAAAFAPASEAAGAPVLERPLRLLLVEDVAINRELVKTVLAAFDIEIETAEDGVAAIAAFQRGAFDLVLMDVQMPVMDGLTATRRIRDLPLPAAKTTPIVAMTANVLPEQIVRCLDAGMDGHLGKPMNPGELLTAIAYWTSHGRAGAMAEVA